MKFYYPIGTIIQIRNRLLHAVPQADHSVLKKLDTIIYNCLETENDFLKLIESDFLDSIQKTADELFILYSIKTCLEARF
jgi:hypothetical protein